MRRGCAFAFVNVEGLHHTPGWTQVPFALFGTTDLPRSAHAIKVPLCLQRPVVYADFKLVERVSVDPFACAEPLRSAQRRNVAKLKQRRARGQRLKRTHAQKQRHCARLQIRPPPH